MNKLIEALKSADEFIRNGIEFGYIRMPVATSNRLGIKCTGRVLAKVEG